MERIWLKVEGFQLCDFGRSKDDPGAAWATVKMGEHSFVIRGYYFKLEKDGYITQNNAMSRMRFFDVPYLHHGKKKPAVLLDDILGKAIHDFYLHGEKGEQLKAFLEGRTELKEFPFFKPEEWGRKSLRIPVDFVALRSMASSLLSNGSVYANVQLGEHLIFWEQLIFDLKDFRYGGSGADRDRRDAIYDKKVVEAINNLLSGKELQKHIRYLSETRGMDFSDTVFFEKAPGYDEKKITERNQKGDFFVPRPVRLY